MSHPPPASIAPLVLRRVRAISGLILLFYVTSHLLNTALGLISIEAMEKASPYLSQLWSARPQGIILALALIAHFAVGLWSIYRRPRLMTNAQDMVQTLTGLTVVPLLATHALGISMGQDGGLAFGYREVLTLFWVVSPGYGLLQVVMLSVVWVHGCAGLLTLLRGLQGARGWLLWIYPLAVLIPVVALLGYAAAGREVLIAARNGPAANVLALADPYGPAATADIAMINATINWVIWGSVLLALFTLAARWMRISTLARTPVQLLRPECASIETTSRMDLLSALLANHEPHANLCGGRGRCGTCAVRILSHEFPLPQPSLLEQRTLLRIKGDSDVRLACQLRADGGAIEVKALYPPDYSFHANAGEEQA